MDTYETIELHHFPSLTKGYLTAAGKLIKSLFTTQHGKREFSGLPKQKFVFKNYRLHADDVVRYERNTETSDSGFLPLTYLYLVAFPMVIHLLTQREFPYIPAGIVHLYNRIRRYRKINKNAVIDLHVYADNLREHRSGMLMDVVTEVYENGDLVWEQVSSMLHRQKTSLSNTPPEPTPDTKHGELYNQETVSADKKIIRTFAAISGDRNPIHMSALTAKLFGFPQMIAHGSWMMSRILASTDKKLPEHCIYEIAFGKPFLVPGKAQLFIHRTRDNWGYSLEKTEKNRLILAGAFYPPEQDKV